MWHEECFKDATELASNVGVLPSVPRVVGRQIHKNNTPADGPSEYYRRTLTIPLLDHLISEFSTRYTL